MDKNADGNISRGEFIERIVELGRENNLFGLTLLRKATVVRPEHDDLGSEIEEDEEEVDATLFRQGLSCLGKTFNNARHAYLKLDISNNELESIKVSNQMSEQCNLYMCTVLTFTLFRELDVTDSCSSSMCQTTSLLHWEPCQTLSISSSWMQATTGSLRCWISPLPPTWNGSTTPKTKSAKFKECNKTHTSSISSSTRTKFRRLNKLRTTRVWLCCLWDATRFQSLRIWTICGWRSSILPRT